jgi:hypothetical protein
MQQSQNKQLSEFVNTKLNGFLNLVKEKGFKANASKQSDVNEYIDTSNFEFKELLDSLNQLDEQKVQKKVKDPLAPKRPRTSYIFYSNENRVELKEKYPDLNQKEFMKKMGEHWNNLSDKAKEPYKNMQEADKKRYESEMVSYVPRESVDEKKTGKKLKDPLAPKKPKNSFMFFCEENRASLKEKNPSVTSTELSKKLGVLWGELSEEGKQKYKDRSDNDQLRYKNELSSYVPSEEFLSGKSVVKVSKPKEKSPWNNFMAKVRPDIKKENPTATFGELSKLLGEKWASLSSEEKNKYKTNETVEEEVAEEPPKTVAKPKAAKSVKQEVEKKAAEPASVPAKVVEVKAVDKEDKASKPKKTTASKTK